MGQVDLVQRDVRRRTTGKPITRAITVAGLAVAAYAWIRILQAGHAVDAVIWFVAAIIAHDAIFLPFYRLSYEIAHRVGRVRYGPRRRTPILRHLVTPTVISACLLIAWVPLILRPASSAATYHAITSVSSDGYLGRWLWITAGLFWTSLVIYVVRALRAGDLPQHPESTPRP